MGQTIAIIILFILVIFEYSMIKSNNNKLRRQKRRYDHLLRGKNPDINMEELILQLNDQIEESSREIRSLDQRASDTKTSSMGAVSKMAVVHFDAFDSQRGKNSFSLTLLDSYHNGIVLTNLYSQDGSNTYLKEIVNGESLQELSDREKECLEKAKL
ncbi:DUF4446 family protein [Anaerococcus hydrogenalis]|uniref:DUF4446 domain-containing protein n=3 Tax=Anaerococcus hydrogenalis TaxID=33029 RepID=F0GYT7_9FIRM|nr:DUF4446 family protein [Anaerococcus hydrogenalis]EEB35202.1 hypothetical protein ANHYDRO_01973 [Anaerococcus hydrogenalis DSM 7454]EGC84610.1 hypothetical protein HMPREF9246_1495 [Anaerococcus hydrogenalis ACS-025-V-Sch4]MDK7695533.1 DUF4446 family protein [Anaerococcus hydrogenalis]MDK7697237.1 DUF4446 family protein [Anaerococcus hydrogenalis]MDK7708560.1 DUF4446 family protein [Anaerococcus hydrogenalis]